MRNKLVLPLLMYKEIGSVRAGTKRCTYVVPTWNHLYVIRKAKMKGETGKARHQPILDEWALRHKEKLAWLAKEWVDKNGWKKTEGRKVYVKVWIYWNDAREKDCHNIDKLPMDAFNDVIYDDDCNALLQYMDFDIDPDNPRIEIEFEAGDFFDRKERVKQIKAENKRRINEDKKAEKTKKESTGKSVKQKIKPEE